MFMSTIVSGVVLVIRKCMSAGPPLVGVNGSGYILIPTNWSRSMQKVKTQICPHYIAHDVCIHVLLTPDVFSGGIRSADVTMWG